MSNNMIELLERILALPNIQVETTQTSIGVRVRLLSVPQMFTIAKYNHLAGQKRGDLHIAGRGFEFVDHEALWPLFEAHEKGMEAKIESMASDWLNQQLAQR